MVFVSFALSVELHGNSLTHSPDGRGFALSVGFAATSPEGRGFALSVSFAATSPEGRGFALIIS